MTDVKTVRKARKLSALQMGRLLGYCGTEASTASAIRAIESGKRELTIEKQRLLWFIERHKFPKEWLD